MGQQQIEMPILRSIREVTVDSKRQRRGVSFGLVRVRSSTEEAASETFELEAYEETKTSRRQRLQRRRMRSNQRNLSPTRWAMSEVRCCGAPVDTTPKKPVKR